MHESSGQNGQNRRKRLLNTKASARVVVTLALALAVVLAGCTGIGGLGGGDAVAEADAPGDGTGGDTTTAAPSAGDGDGSGGAGGDSGGDDGNAGADPRGDGGEDGGLGDVADSIAGGASNGADAGSVFGEDAEGEANWFNLSQPGHYAFDLTGMDSATGEQVTGRLVYDVEAVGDGQVTTSVDYQFGGEQFQSSTTGPAEEASTQLFLNEAYVPISTLQSVSMLYLFEMGFTDPAVGNRKQSSTEEGTQVTEVTEERSYAGLDCVFVETTLDGEPSRQGCLRGSEGGIAPYAAIYTDEGELELEVELVEYNRG